jgi:mono/diheme cytochrome c family protein
MTTHHATLRRMNTLLLIVLISWALPPRSDAQEDEIIAGGKIKYQQYCANCHGETGTGEGKIAALLVFKPTNLTHLSKQHKGEFPFWRVYRAIDGRDFVRGHGNREMPLWGFVFQVEEDATGTSAQFDLVRGRIWQLVYYLESIQER